MKKLISVPQLSAVLCLLLLVPLAHAEDPDPVVTPETAAAPTAAPAALGPSTATDAPATAPPPASAATPLTPAAPAVGDAPAAAATPPTPVTTPAPAADPTVAATTPAATPDPTGSRLFRFAAGYSMLNAHWSFWDQRSTVKESQIHYDVQQSWYRQAEGDFYQPFIGLRFGFSTTANSDVVQKARQYSGYLGLKKVDIRAQSGAFRGATRWDGSLAPGQSALAEFDQKFTEIDARYWFSAWFMGLRYTEFKTPVEIGILNRPAPMKPPVGLTSAFDREFEAKFYSITFGIDSFIADLLYDGAMIGDGFGPFVHAEDGLGFGRGHISGEAASAMSLLNSKKIVSDTTPFIVAIHNDSTLGIRYQFSKWGAKFSAGLGYSLYFLFIGGFPKQGENTGQIEPEISPFFIRHGVALKAMIVL